jgi:hypothetical protein
MKRKGLYHTGILFVLIILLSGNSLAFAVSSKYYENYPMYVPAGETQDVQLILQNLASSEDVMVRADIVSGGEIIKIVDLSNEYLIPAGEKTTVNMQVTIPAGVKLQKIYNVDVKFTTITTSDSGQFGLVSGIDKGFDVVVGEGPVPEKQIGWQIFLIIGIVILALAILLIRKKSQTGKRK